MNELHLETGPINPYARTFFWLWGAALLALAGFRAINSTEPPSGSVVNVAHPSVRQPGSGMFLSSLRLASQANTHSVPLLKPLN